MVPIRRGHFVARKKGSLIEVWMPPMDDPEGELVLCLDESLLPDMIAVLKAVKDE